MSQYRVTGAIVVLAILTAGYVAAAIALVVRIVETVAR